MVMCPMYELSVVLSSLVLWIQSLKERENCDTLVLIGGIFK